MALSGLEREWNSAPPAHALRCFREEQFDDHSGLFYAPLRFETEPVLTCTQPVVPDDTWIADALVAFSRAEFGSRAVPQPLPPEPVVRAVDGDLLGVAREYLAACEQHLVYGDYFENLTKSDAFGLGMHHALHAVLSSKELGNKKNARNVTAESLGELLSTSVDPRVGVRLLVPGLPFRDQNPFRTSDTAEEATLAEAAFLIRLHCIALAIFQVVPAGSHIVVVCDGRAYAPILGVDEGRAGTYLNNLRALRSQLNLDGTVALLDLADVVDRFVRSPSGRAYFDQTLQAVEDQLWLLESQPPNKDVAEALQAIERGIRWNLNLRRDHPPIDRQQLWDWLHEPPGVPGTIWDISVDSRAAAFRYTAYNLALRYHRVVETMLPGCLRGTTHPKPGQIAMPSLGRASPWNGVALLKAGQQVAHDSVKTVPLHELASAGGLYEGATQNYSLRRYLYYREARL